MKTRWNALKRVFIPLFIILAILASYILGTGFTLVEPGTVKVINKEMGFNAHFINSGTQMDLVWKGVLKPEIKFENKDFSITLPLVEKTLSFSWKWWPRIGLHKEGRLKEVINLEGLKFQKKLNIFSLDRETGNLGDKDKIVAFIISGDLEIKDWKTFISAYNPDYFNEMLEEEDLAFQKFNTLDYWGVMIGEIATSVIGQWQFLFFDTTPRYEYVRSLIEKNPDLNPELIESYIKDREPWIWVTGPEIFEFLKTAPGLLLYDKSDIGKILYDIITALNFRDESKIMLQELKESQDKYYRLIKENLTSEAEFLMKEFLRDLKDLGEGNLAAIKSPGILETRVENFLKKMRESKIGSEDGYLVFSMLLENKWVEAAILSEQKNQEEVFSRAVVALKEHSDFSNEINAYHWQLVMQAALANPNATEDDLGRLVLCPFLRNPALWEPLKEILAEGSLSWKINNASIEIKEVPLFIDGQVDPDFRFFYEFNKEKYEKK